MSKLKLALILCSIPLAALNLTVLNADALDFDPGNITIKSGSGEELTYKKGMFGKKQVLVKDRIGNKYEKKQGVFGGRSKEVNVLGNQYKSSHSLLGDKSEGRSFFGDSVTVKKGAFGRRSTEVDLSGIAGVVKGLMGGSEPFSDAPLDNSSESLIDAYKGQGPVNGNAFKSPVGASKTGIQEQSHALPQSLLGKQKTDRKLTDSIESSVDYMHAPVSGDPEYQWGGSN